MIKNIQIKDWFSKNKEQGKNEVAKILDVEYAHLILENYDDLYVTKHGLPFIENLKPENFYTDEKWFNENSIRLCGTSCLYKVRTKEIQGKGKDIVIKWNRMGQDIPGLGESEDLMTAEFNSPFEEFSLVMELRDVMLKFSDGVIIPKPLGIYVPSKSVEFWQTGRKDYVMRSIIQKHKDVILDMFRSYAVIYEWIQGVDLAQALKRGVLNEDYMKYLTLGADDELIKNGFLVRDNKPQHIIVRPKEHGYVVRDKKGRVIYGLVDFELLERTSENKENQKKIKRFDYLRRQRDRFIEDSPNIFHPHLKHMNIFGLDYIYGHAESTKGRLWVVGKDPFLFDYFLPERWEKTPKVKISLFNEMYHTVTKDNIHIVWKVSRVGLQPDMDIFKDDEKKIMKYGYNSPFEELSIAMELSNKGIATTYPRAIYMTGQKAEISDILSDNRRYERHEGYITPDGMPILKKGHDYMIIWGYWNGPDEKLAAQDSDYYEGIDALRAYRKGIITRERYITLLQVTKEKLSKAGIEDLNLRGNHLLISLNSKGILITDEQGMPEIRLCNFEFLKRI